MEIYIVTYTPGCSGKNFVVEYKAHSNEKVWENFPKTFSYPVTILKVLLK